MNKNVYYVMSFILAINVIPVQAISLVPQGMTKDMAKGLMNRAVEGARDGALSGGRWALRNGVGLGIAGIRQLAEHISTLVGLQDQSKIIAYLGVALAAGAYLKKEGVAFLVLLVALYHYELKSIHLEQVSAALAKSIVAGSSFTQIIEACRMQLEASKLADLLNMDNFSKLLEMAQTEAEKAQIEQFVANFNTSPVMTSALI